MDQEQNDFEQLDPNLIRAEHLSSLIFFIVVLVVGLVAWTVIAFLGWGFRDYRTWAILLTSCLLFIFLGWWSYRYPHLRWQTTRWRESDRGLELHRGIYWQHKIFVPRERIQHTDITQGPISRRFQIADLVINTAGNHNYEIRIEGLNEDRAKRLRLELLPRVRTRETATEQSSAFPPAMGYEPAGPSEAQTSIDLIPDSLVPDCPIPDASAPENVTSEPTSMSTLKDEEKPLERKE